jgi:hypothetical protein
MSDPDTHFPPVIVYFDGTDHWLADGFHRVAAWERIGRSDISADIRQGNKRDAILHSLKANSTLGLRRSNEDKRHAVKMLLEDEEWSQWSNREIARRCAVSDILVATVRAGLTANSCSDEPEAVRTFTTKHGTAAQMKVAKIGGDRRPKASGHRADRIRSLASRADVDTSAATRAERDALAKLTPEAMIDDVIGLRADLIEARARIEEHRSETDDLRAQLKAALDCDSGRVIAGLRAQLKHAEAAKARATEEQGRLQKRVFALQTRVKELESMRVPL